MFYQCWFVVSYVFLWYFPFLMDDSHMVNDKILKLFFETLFFPTCRCRWCWNGLHHAEYIIVEFRSTNAPKLFIFTSIFYCFEYNALLVNIFLLLSPSHLSTSSFDTFVFGILSFFPLLFFLRVNVSTMDASWYFCCFCTFSSI